MHLSHRLREFAASFVEVFTSRFELAAAELQDLLSRVGVMVSLGFACMSAASLALLFLGLAIVLAVPDAYRWIPALVFALFFGIVTTLAGWQLRRLLRDQPPPFASTRGVLQRDITAIRRGPDNATAETAAEDRPPTTAP